MGIVWIEPRKARLALVAHCERGPDSGRFGGTRVLVSIVAQG